MKITSRMTTQEMIDDYKRSRDPKGSIHAYAKAAGMKPSQVAFMLRQAGCRVDGRLLKDTQSVVRVPRSVPTEEKKQPPRRGPGVSLAQPLPIWLL